MYAFQQNKVLAMEELLKINKNSNNLKITVFICLVSILVFDQILCLVKNTEILELIVFNVSCVLFIAMITSMVDIFMSKYLRLEGVFHHPLIDISVEKSCNYCEELSNWTQHEAIKNYVKLVTEVRPLLYGDYLLAWRMSRTIEGAIAADKLREKFQKDCNNLHSL